MTNSRGALLLLAGLAGAATPRTGAAQTSRPTSVLYAGSLGGVMEKTLGPAFEKITGYAFRGEGQGSVGAARMIRDGLRAPDVFVSADASVNTKILMGTENRHLVQWYLTFASSGLVLGYNPKSSFRELFEQAKAVRTPWYEVLAKPGVRLGRTDPNLDPKGYRTLFLFELAARHYGKPDLVKLLGASTSATQTFPEPELLVRLEAGQLDAAIFYRHEVLAHGLAFIELPDEINQSNPRLASLYQECSYTNEKGVTTRGAPVVFTVTIPSTARNLPGAVAFVRFLLSDTGRGMIENYGLRRISLRLDGDASKMPVGLAALVSTAKAS